MSVLPKALSFIRVLRRIRGCSVLGLLGLCPMPAVDVDVLLIVLDRRLGLQLLLLFHLPCNFGEVDALLVALNAQSAWRCVSTCRAYDPSLLVLNRIPPIRWYNLLCALDTRRVDR